MKKYFLLFLLLLTLVGCDSKATESNNDGSGVVDSGNGTEDGDVVTGEKGTLGNPYTIAEALTIIGTESTFSTNEIYIKGKVEGKPYYNTKYSSYSVYLVDDAGGKTVQVYSATLANGLSVSSINEGDLIVAGGHYTYFQKNSQPELAGDNASKTPYPVIYSINGVSANPSADDANYETIDDDGRATETVTLEFNEESKNAYATVEGFSWFWRKDNFVFENSAGQYRINEVITYLPYRFYVQSIVYCSVKTGTIKYLEFETDQNYPFYGDEEVTNCKVEVVSKTLTRVYAKKGYSKVRLRNENAIKNKKQIRVKSIKVVYYK